MRVGQVTTFKKCGCIPVRVRWLWIQDDVCYHEDSPEKAWKKIFAEELPSCRSESWIRKLDLGDADLRLLADGRVYLGSYPGNCAIGVVAGPTRILSGSVTTEVW